MEESLIKNLANVITGSRIVFATIMLIVKPFSLEFWLCYFCAGLSDMFDGFIARKLHQESDFGAALDSIADLIFLLSIFIFIIINVKLHNIIWIIIGIIAIVRIISYIIGFYKYKTFFSLHTYANKITGGLIFTFPLLYLIFGLIFTEIVLCFAAIISSLEELVITIKSKKINRNCKTIFKIKDN